MSRAKDRAAVGGKTKWTPERKAETFDRICDELTIGKSLRAICNAPDMPNRGTVIEWMNGDTELSAKYEQARQLQAEYLADEIIEIADSATDPHRARLQIDARKWLASKPKPKRYGEKIEHSGEFTQNIIMDRPMTPEEWNAEHADASPETTH
jgi:hypothetical protein